MNKPKEYWIRKGTNRFTYEVGDDADPEGVIRRLALGDQFYDAVVETPINGGVHVIEKAAYDRVLTALKQSCESAHFEYCSSESPCKSVDQHIARKLAELGVS